MIVDYNEVIEPAEKYTFAENNLDEEFSDEEEIEEIAYKFENSYKVYFISTILKFEF